MTQERIINIASEDKFSFAPCSLICLWYPELQGFHVVYVVEKYLLFLTLSLRGVVIIHTWSRPAYQETRLESKPQLVECDCLPIVSIDKPDKYIKRVTVTIVGSW